MENLKVRTKACKNIKIISDIVFITLMEKLFCFNQSTHYLVIKTNEI